MTKTKSLDERILESNKFFPLAEVDEELDSSSGSPKDLEGSREEGRSLKNNVNYEGELTDSEARGPEREEDTTTVKGKNNEKDNDTDENTNMDTDNDSDNKQEMETDTGKDNEGEHELENEHETEMVTFTM
ncbi:hypothetical protein CHS0354_025981 [Potamilus streckersoni]|uniref:Uncharacterized protein n=1 Tax=Potamilus streckersoni TaxID=2493646 RepID=A0AAE0T431_9BIVA|nr:hypothetical protein CHS0354_025981 [Potamilus streckersoni]